MPTASPVLSDDVKAFLEAPRPATIATADPDGVPHQAVIWFRLASDGRILVNSRAGRRWPRELEASGVASLVVVDEADRNRWLSLGLAVDEVVRDPAAALGDIVALSHRYDEASEASIADWQSQERVTYLLRITACHAELGG